MRLSGHDVYYATELRAGQRDLVLAGEEFHHLCRVARHRVGDPVAVTNGRGLMAVGRVKAIRKESAILEFSDWMEDHGESYLRLWLGVGMIRSQRFDWLVEKATELGVIRISPLLTKYARSRDGEAKAGRWRRLAIAAMKQCQRSVLPEVDDPMPLAEWLEQLPPSGPRLAAIPEAEMFVGHWICNARLVPPLELVALVGPEGGFAAEEVQLAQSRGFVGVSLGPRRLRTETAALLLCSLLLNMIPAKEGR